MRLASDRAGVERALSETALLPSRSTPASAHAGDEHLDRDTPYSCRRPSARPSDAATSMLRRCSRAQKKYEAAWHLEYLGILFHPVKIEKYSSSAFRSNLKIDLSLYILPVYKHVSGRLNKRCGVVMMICVPGATRGLAASRSLQRRAPTTTTRTRTSTTRDRLAPAVSMILMILHVALAVPGARLLSHRPTATRSLRTFEQVRSIRPALFGWGGHVSRQPSGVGRRHVGIVWWYRFS